MSSNFPKFGIKLSPKGEFMKKFAERLKLLRMEKGLSLVELAQKVGIGKSSISRWENSQCDVLGSQLVILAKFFDVSVDYLLGLVDD